MGAQYSVLSLVTTPCVEIKYFENTSVKKQRTSELSFAESQCADAGTNDSGILQRSLKSVEPVCFPASHRALFPHETAWVSCGDCSYRKKNTLGAPTLKFYIRRREEAFCLPGGVQIFSTKCMGKRYFFPEKSVFETYFESFVQIGLWLVQNV